MGNPNRFPLSATDHSFPSWDVLSLPIELEVLGAEHPATGCAVETRADAAQDTEALQGAMDDDLRLPKICSAHSPGLGSPI